MRRRQRAAGGSGVAHQYTRDRRRLSRTTRSDRPQRSGRAATRNARRLVRNPRRDRPRRDGDRVSGTGRTPRPPRRAQVAAGRCVDAARSARAPASRGSSRRDDLASRGRRRLCARGSRRQSVHRHGVRAGRDAEKRDRTRPTATRSRTQHRHRHRRRAGGGARSRRDPSRSEAGERADQVRRQRQGGGLRRSRMSRAPTCRA